MKRAIKSKKVFSIKHGKKIWVNEWEDEGRGKTCTKASKYNNEKN